ncbi:hypothetical protein GT642_10500 [Butyricicoccus sp. BIOML-A1]|jgi:hypothetical protein|nr:hypothetical protein [Butyricicoccus sp. BIOML-A1]
MKKTAFTAEIGEVWFGEAVAQKENRIFTGQSLSGCSIHGISRFVSWNFSGICIMMIQKGGYGK